MTSVLPNPIPAPRYNAPAVRMTPTPRPPLVAPRALPELAAGIRMDAEVFSTNDPRHQAMLRIATEIDQLACLATASAVATTHEATIVLSLKALREASDRDIVERLRDGSARMLLDLVQERDEAADAIDALRADLDVIERCLSEYEADIDDSIDGKWVIYRDGRFHDDPRIEVARASRLADACRAALGGAP